MEQQIAKIILKVGELTAREDFSRGLAVIDKNMISGIGAKEGDVIEIEGKRKTAAIAVKLKNEGIGLNVIRMDGLTRKKC